MAQRPTTIRFHGFIWSASLLCLCFITAIPAAGASESITVTLLATSDVHAHVFPYDYFRGEAAPRGFAKISTLVEQIRSQSPNVLLFDSGDTIQGSPLAYYHYRVDPTPVNPVIAAMNAMGYDAMAIGNHEFNYGREILDQARTQSRFPWLAANILRNDGEPAFGSYVVLETGGVRIGVLGLTTHKIPYWEKPRFIEGLQFLPSLDAAKKLVPFLRETERCDAVVLLAHQGFERDLRTGEDLRRSDENQAYAIATQVPGIDVILAGHAHKNIPPRTVGNALVSMPSSYGQRLTRIDLAFQPRPGGGFRLLSKSGENLAVKGVEPDPRILDICRPFHQRTLAYIEGPVGNLSAPLDGRRARLEDTAMMDLLQEMQLEVTGADLSLASMLPWEPPVFRAGMITVRDIYSFYIYDNTLMVIEVTGRKIKEALEVAASYYKDAKMDPTGALLLRRNPKVAPYNFDILAGATYRIDPTKPVGERILNLRYQGRPMDPDQRFRLALNNYRAGGSAGYSMFRDAPRVWESTQEIRSLLIDYIRRKGTISPHCDQNWVLAPTANFVQEQR